MDKKPCTDRTRNERQARRREREARWLAANGWGSWEALHTALMKGTVALTKTGAKGEDPAGGGGSN